MGKYKLYFRKPDVQMPPGEWTDWIPDAVEKRMKLISLVVNVIAAVLIFFIITFMNRDGELTAWAFQFVENIDSIMISRALAIVFMLIAVVFIAIVHEILHLLITFGKGDWYIFWNKSGFVSAYNDCELSWGQLIICRLLPFLVLSVCFFAIGFAIGGVAGGFLKFIAVINLVIVGNCIDYKKEV